MDVTVSKNRVPEEIIDHYLIKTEEKSFLDFSSVFNNDNDIKIDIGCGNGHFLVDMAKQYTDSNFIGIELKYYRVCKCISKFSKRDIDNVRMFHGDAGNFLNEYFPDNSIKELYYNFPDPWPKRRHHKKRLFTPSFLDTLYRIMKKDAIFTCATDHADYLKWMLNYLEKDNRFEMLFNGKILNNIPGYPTTLFEQLWKEMGRDLYYFRFKIK